MTPLQLEPSAHAPWMRTIFGRAFISGIPSWSCLVAIVRSKSAASGLAGAGVADRLARPRQVVFHLLSRPASRVSRWLSKSDYAFQPGGAVSALRLHFG